MHTMKKNCQLTGMNDAALKCCCNGGFDLHACCAEHHKTHEPLQCKFAAIHAFGI